MMSMRALALDTARERLVCAGVIGCGAFGAGILAQAGSVPLLDGSAATDPRVGAARQALERAGGPEAAIRRCDSRSAALRAFEAGQRVIVSDPMLLLELPLDVVVEATGSPEAGALHAEAAIRHGRHVA